MMKKLRYLFSTFLLLLVAGVTWAADESVTFSQQGYSNGEAVETYTGTNFSIAFDKGSNNNAPKYYTTGTAIRAYGGNTFTVTSEDNITQIVISFASGEGSNAITADVGTYSNGTWTGSAKSVKFTVGGTSGHRRLSAFAVTMEDDVPADEVGTPVFSVNGEVFSGNTGNNYVFPGEMLTITSQNATKIWYRNGLSDSFTFDASGNPTNQAIKEYTEPIAIYPTTSATFTAIGVNNGTRSEAGYVVFLIKAHDPELSHASGAVTAGTEVTLSVPEGERIVYTIGEELIVDGDYNPNAIWTTGNTATVTINEATTIEAKGVYYDVNNNNYKYYSRNFVNAEYTVKQPVVTTGNGTAENPYTVADALALLDDGQNPEGVYVKGIVSKIVTPYNPEYGNISYNISDDGTTEAGQLEAYRGLGLNGDPFTSADDLLPGDEVVVYGNLTIYNNKTKEFAQGNYLYSHTRNTPEVTKYYLNGSFNEWGEGIEFTYNATDNTYTLADQTLAAGALVKISDSNNNWYTSAAGGSQYWITADNHTDLVMSTEYPNTNYYFDEAGTYTFTISFTETGAPLLTVTGWPEPPVVVEEGDYVKVTSTDDLVDGAEYLIVYEDGSVAFDGGLETLDAVGNTIDVTISDNTIKGNATVDAATFTIDTTEGTVLSKSGYYIGQNNDANILHSSNSEVYTNSMYIDEDGNAVIVGNLGGHLRFNSASNQMRFRYFKATSYANQKAIQLYRKVAEVVAPVDYYLIGTFNEWNQETMVKFTRSGNTYTAEQAIEAGGEFKILDPNTGEYGSWYGGPTPEATYNVNSGWYENLPMATDGKNYQINEAGTYTFTITVTDEAGPRLTVTGWPEPKYYLTGSFNNWDESVELVYDETTGKYTATQEVSNGETFKIKHGFAENPNDFTWYGAITDDGNNYRIHDEWYENIPLDANGSDIEIEINETTTLTFTLDANNMTLTVTGWPVEESNSTIYKRVTDATQIVAGQKYIVVTNTLPTYNVSGTSYTYTKYIAMGSPKGDSGNAANQRSGIAVDVTNDMVDIANLAVTVLTAEAAPSGMAFKASDNDKYLGIVSGKNQVSASDDAVAWTITADVTESVINGYDLTIADGNDTRTLAFNVNSSAVDNADGKGIYAAYKTLNATTIKGYLFVQTDEEIQQSIDVTIGSTGYATMYYSDKNLVVPEGVVAKTYTVTNGSLEENWVYEEGEVIPAGTGVVLETAEPATYTFTVTTEDGDVDADNMLRGTDAATTIGEKGYKYYILSKSSDGQEVGFYYQSGDGSSVNNGAHKAYLAVPQTVAGNAKGWSFDGEATGINAVINGAAVEGKAEIYNLSGVRMNSQNLPKGIYIVNGKKMVVK